jgi:hypothetical protein
MSKIQLLGKGIPVEAMQAALAAHPELWDQHTARTEHPDSPHHGLSDIWARYAESATAGAEAHKSAWYPCADVLPVRELTYPLMSLVDGDELGGVLITKIPAGKECRPHVDHGWHARYYQKFAIQIHADPGQTFHFEDGSLVTEPGDLFTFDNAYMHWVTNPTAYDRVTMIVCIRTEKRW